MQCDCPDNISPVCGSDNKSYSNGCLAKCNNVAIKHDGECKTKC